MGEWICALWLEGGTGGGQPRETQLDSRRNLHTRWWGGGGGAGSGGRVFSKAWELLGDALGTTTGYKEDDVEVDDAMC